MERRSEKWHQHWEDRSKLKDEISVSGWGSKQVKEYLYDIDDVCKKLELTKEDHLLNIGCGNGLMEIILNYWVSRIDSLDFSEGMLERAKRNNAGNRNVQFFAGNILELNTLNSKYDKVLCNSVIQYLNNTEEIARAIEQIGQASKERVNILISANPNKSKFNEFISGYDKLDMAEDIRQNKKEAAKMSLWTEPNEIKEIAGRMGYKAKIMEMNSNVWQSWYMYDLLLWR